MIKNYLATTSLLSLFALAELPAQTQNTVFLGDGNPAVGSSNTFPWSKEGIRYQTIFQSAQFSTSGTGTFLINDILVAPQLTISPTIKTAVYDDIEIIMGATPQVVPTTSWATNNPNPTTVYRGPLRVTFEKAVWRGMGLPKPFLFLQTPAAPNLCIEVIIWKNNVARNADTVSVRTLTDTSATPAVRAYYNAWTTSQATPPSVGTSAAKIGLVIDSGNFVPTETGCMSSSNTVLAIGSSTFPQVTKLFDITLSGGLPNSAAFLAVGLSDVMGYGNLPLPIDASIFGATGCNIWNEDSLLVGAGVDASGGAKLAFVIPKGLGNLRAYAHWWNMDKAANKFGWTTSNYAKILLGN